MSAKIKLEINLKRQKYAGCDVFLARCLLWTKNTHEVDIIRAQQEQETFGVVNRRQFGANYIPVI